ncbi:hypothetical protein [Geodermatophilus sabuli]|uniref:GGDEF domain-containing protein, diguanylate cyclase (C-di-GMP synthetase) or its enzymatically inactive variants n=1 Tax=Geodermatophilus sabuli TaxID=1564158 RepID=A0A285EI17_9ACTN|nr:hypothetical protein [Geodermatophilus sabuli]MBB3086874.1 hypothetical protein [Geodermatophilus sabuli]SNX98752.1 GGDEF domain-containing protein, diguanylate cyclase (c-di-GMP synthetase) or its enzymatically inactive variants [Geodermatophilus sabuli]
MTIAHNPLGVSLPVSDLLPPEEDVTSLLPGPISLHTQLTERLAADTPGALLVIGLLHGDGAETTTAGNRAVVTTIVARSVRGDDWLGRSGPDQLALVLGGGISGAVTAAARVIGEISALGRPGLGVCAGVSLLEAGVPAREVLRRARTALEAACAAGSGAVSVR